MTAHSGVGSPNGDCGPEGPKQDQTNSLDRNCGHGELMLDQIFIDGAVDCEEPTLAQVFLTVTVAHGQLLLEHIFLGLLQPMERTHTGAGEK